MKKLDLNIDFIGVEERIRSEIKDMQKKEWAAKIGVSPNVVSNIHGSRKQKPSLEYICAVAKFTGKPIEYYLYGEIISKNEYEGDELLKDKYIKLLEEQIEMLKSKIADLERESKKVENPSEPLLTK